MNLTVAATKLLANDELVQELLAHKDIAQQPPGRILVRDVLRQQDRLPLSYRAHHLAELYARVTGGRQLDSSQADREYLPTYCHG